MGRAGSDAPPEPRSGGRVLLTLDFRLLSPRTGRESIRIVLSLPATPVCGRRYQKPHLGHSMFCVPKIHRSTAPQPGQSALVITGCLLSNKPPDSGERLALHTGAPSVCGSKRMLPRGGSASHTCWPRGSKGGHTPLSPCALHTLPSHNCRRPGQQTFQECRLAYLPPLLLLHCPFASPHPCFWASLGPPLELSR